AVYAAAAALPGAGGAASRTGAGTGLGRGFGVAFGAAATAAGPAGSGNSGAAIVEAPRKATSITSTYSDINPRAAMPAFLNRCRRRHEGATITGSAVAVDGPGAWSCVKSDIGDQR